MKVIIGVDPHKATRQAVAVNDREAEIDRISVRATRTQTERLLSWSTPFTELESLDRGHVLPPVIFADGCSIWWPQRLGHSYRRVGAKE